MERSGKSVVALQLLNRLTNLNETEYDQHLNKDHSTHTLRFFLHLPPRIIIIIIQLSCKIPRWERQLMQGPPVQYVIMLTKYVTSIYTVSETIK